MCLKVPPLLRLPLPPSIPLTVVLALTALHPSTPLLPEKEQTKWVLNWCLFLLQHLFSYLSVQFPGTRTRTVPLPLLLIEPILQDTPRSIIQNPPSETWALRQCIHIPTDRCQCHSSLYSAVNIFCPLWPLLGNQPVPPFVSAIVKQEYACALCVCARAHRSVSYSSFSARSPAGRRVSLTLLLCWRGDFFYTVRYFFIHRHSLEKWNELPLPSPPPISLPRTICANPDPKKHRKQDSILDP